MSRQEANKNDSTSVDTMAHDFPAADPGLQSLALPQRIPSEPSTGISSKLFTPADLLLQDFIEQSQANTPPTSDELNQPQFQSLSPEWADKTPCSTQQLIKKLLAFQTQLEDNIETLQRQSNMSADSAQRHSMDTGRSPNDPPVPPLPPTESQG